MLRIVRGKSGASIFLPLLVSLPLHVAPLSVKTGNIKTMKTPSTAEVYEPPSWVNGFLTATPQDGRLRLANLPTPLYQLDLQSLASNLPFAKLLYDLECSFYIKRDDASGGVELGGNKIRKLEFLLAQAIAQSADCVVTIGGEQSNHCRATAAACRMVGLEPQLILRSKHADDGDLGLVGNLLMDRMVGSTIYKCTPGEYGRLGSKELVGRVCEYLREKEGKKPYAIPVGGSNGLGTWGYIEAIREFTQQWDNSSPVDHVFFACGSGGTAAGIALGFALYYKGKNGPRVHAMGVCDDPDYFYKYVASIADELGLQQDECASTEDYIREHMEVHQSKGLGYAVSTPQELEAVSLLAKTTGIVLDPVYSGKAFHNFYAVVRDDPDQFKGKRILFWHTGGALGLYDKCSDLAFLSDASPCLRLDVYGKSKDVDISAPTSSNTV